jgi:hypothetical protein
MDQDALIGRIMNRFVLLATILLSWATPSAFANEEAIDAANLTANRDSSSDIASKLPFQIADQKGRMKIVSDLLRDRDLIGVTKDELTNILGKPDVDDQPTEYNEFTEVISFAIRHGAPIDLPGYYISFKLNKAHKVTGWQGSSAPWNVWITENVTLLCPDGPLSLGNVVPKKRL